MWVEPEVTGMSTISTEHENYGVQTQKCRHPLTLVSCWRESVYAKQYGLELMMMIMEILSQHLGG